MKVRIKHTLILTALLYAPFIIVVRDPFSPWWHWFAIPGWPVQIIHSSNTFALIGGAVFTIILIGVFSLLCGVNSKRFYLFSIMMLIYSIGSAFFLQWAIHAG